MIRQRADKVFYSESAGTQFAEIDGVPNSCQAFISNHTALSDLLLDITWLLKEPQLDKNENCLTSTQVQRMNCLLRFLIQNQCISVLERILQSLMNVMEAVRLYDGVNKTNDADGMDVRMEDGRPSAEASASQGSDIHVSLINKEVVMDVNHILS